MRILDTFLAEYDRQRTAGSVGDGLWQSYLKDELAELHPNVWRTPNSALQNLTATDVGPDGVDKIKSLYANQKQQQQWKLDCLDELETADPTNNKKYTLWLARQYAKGITKMEDMRSSVRQNLEKFNKLGAKRMLKPEHRDLGRFTSMNDFYRTMESYPDPFDIFDTLGHGTYDTVHETAAVTVYVPKDQAASCYLGRNTRWCTAVIKGNNYFDSYNNQGPLYILIPKSPRYDGEKYQIHWEQHEVKDEDNEDVNVYELLNKRFPGLLDFFRKTADLGDYIAFANDRIIEDLVTQLREPILDKANDLLSDWELSDDSYYAWLRSEEILDDEGDIDWERAPSYLDYNTEAQHWYTRIKSAVDIDAEDVKHEELDEMGHQYLPDMLELDDLTDVIVHRLDRQFGRRSDEASGITDYLSRHIMIKKRAGNWVVVTK